MGLDMPKTIRPDIKGVTAEVVSNRFAHGEWTSASVHVPCEMELTVYVNQQALVTILCTPDKLDALAYGYLYAEGIISDIGDVASIRLSEEEALADVTLNDPDFALPTLRKLGCSGSSIFKTQAQKFDSKLVAKPEDVLSLMRELLEKMELYKVSGGVHTSALADSKNLLVVAEDIGRHNTLNKIQGECLLKGIATADKILLITGRISSEMLLKAAKMQVPIVCSRHAPTKNAILLANDLGITLVGQVRDDRLAVFANSARLGLQQNQP